jgi:hypothetical protein
VAWVKFDDNFTEHPKVAGLDDRSFRLWVTAIAYSARFRLDGCIPRADFMRLAREISARKAHRTCLISARLLREACDHFEIHDYSDYQPTAANYMKVSTKRREAGLRGAAARWKLDGNLPSAKNAPDPTRPDPTPKEKRQTEFDADGGVVSAHYVLRFPKRRKQAYSMAAQSKITARLREGYSASDLCKAIDGMVSSEFHMDNGYNSLELVVRNAAKVDQFMAKSEAARSTGQQGSPHAKATQRFIDKMSKEEPWIPGKIPRLLPN